MSATLKLPLGARHAWARVVELAHSLTNQARERLPQALGPLWEVPLQIRAVRRLSRASEAMEVEDYEAARDLFMAVVATDLPRATRLLAYQGAVVALLRLGAYDEALQLGDDAGALLALALVDGTDSEAEEIRKSLREAARFAEWAIAHPERAADMREQESWWREAGAIPDEPAADSLGSASTWPTPARVVYRGAVLTVLAAGLAAAAIDRGRPALRLLEWAMLVARYDRRIERDICWHLARLQERWGQREAAAAHQERYERLSQLVRQELLRRRWTN